MCYKWIRNIFYNLISRESAIYIVRFLAFDTSVTLIAELQLIVDGDIPCNMPDVKIVDPATYLSTAKPKYRSYVAKFESTTLLECNKTVTVMWVK